MVFAKKKPPRSSMDADDIEDENSKDNEGNKENESGERLNRTGTLARSRRRMKEVGRVFQFFS